MKRTILILAAVVCCSYGFSKKPQYLDSYNYQRGKELIENDELDEGIEILWKEISQNPKNGYAFAWLAMAYCQKQEFGTSITCATDALKKFPKSEKYYAAWTHRLLSGIYYEMKDTVMLIPVEDLHIGHFIRNKLREQGRSVTWLAQQIPCTRNHMYKIFQKPNVDTALLLRISCVMNYNFFDDFFQESDA